METKQDISYGVIPIRKVDGKWKVLLIHQWSQIKNNSYWIFPKGHPEGDETSLQTASRELKEETDVVTEKIIERPSFKLEYTFVFDGVKIEKQVIFFVGITDSDYFKADGVEVKEAGWYSLNEASERLDYKDTKKMFQAAREFIEEY